MADTRAILDDDVHVLIISHVAELLVQAANELSARLSLAGERVLAASDIPVIIP